MTASLDEDHVKYAVAITAPPEQHTARMTASTA